MDINRTKKKLLRQVEVVMKCKRCKQDFTPKNKERKG